ERRTENGEPRTENGEPRTENGEPVDHRLASQFSVLGSRFSVRSFKNEPLTDFSLDDSRAAMQAALAEVKTQFGRTYPLVIAGKQVPTAASIASINPSHIREIVGQCGRATPDQARDAVTAAAAAFAGWRATSAEVRADYLVRVAAVMRRRRFELAAWEVYE